MDTDKILLHSIVYFATEKRHSFLKIHPCNKNVTVTFSVAIWIAMDISPKSGNCPIGCTLKLSVRNLHICEKAIKQKEALRGVP